MRDRETSQLLLVACHYSSLAKRLVARDQALRNITIKQIVGYHNPASLSREELVLAHLGSASTRLCTICEKHKGLFSRSYREQFYQHKNRRKGKSQSDIILTISSSLETHIHFLLRDNIGHKEKDKDIGKDRFAIIQDLTVGRTIDSFELAFQHICETIKNAGV